jgi:large repetitive protein
MRPGPRTVRIAFLAGAIVVGFLVAIGTPAAAAAMGPGAMSVSSEVVLEGSTGNTLAFTYTAGSNGFSQGTLNVKVPTGWSPPQIKRTASPGYVSASLGKLTTHMGHIKLTNVTLCASCTATITYSNASAPDMVETSLFAARAAPSGTRPKPLSSSPSVLVGDLPSAPTITSVTPGFNELGVTFTASMADPSVLEYLVTCGSQSASTPYADLVEITGLVGGTEVECTVYAENELGNGPSSAPVSSTPAIQPPGPPDITSFSVGEGSLTVSYEAPSSGGAPIIGYTASCGSNSTTVSGSTLTATVTGLTDGTLYSCTLVATNTGGNSEGSGWGGIPGPPEVPVITSVLPADGQLTIVYDAVDSNDAPSSYTGACGGQSVTVNGSTTWITIDGLTDGTSYPCSVFATNGAGDGPASTAVSGIPDPLSSSPTSSADGQFAAVSCPTTSECVAVGAGGPSQQTGLVEVSNDGGSTFTDQPVPSGTQDLNSVTCLNGLDCIAVGGSSVLLTSDGGMTWRSEYGQGPLSSVSCLSATNCVAVGWASDGQRSQVSTSDGGLTWQESTGPEALLDLTDVACTAPASTCFAVGGFLGMSTDMGQTWGSFGVESPFVGTPSSVSCAPTTTMCVLVGPNPEGEFDPSVPGIAAITTDAGSLWTNISSNLPAGSSSIDSISCPTADTCYASGYVGSTGAVTDDGGQTWTSFSDPSNVTPGYGIGSATGATFGQALSCPSTTTCVVVGYGSSGPAAAYTTDSAADWSATSSIG